MRARRFQIDRGLCAGVVGLHALFLFAAVAVPGYAVFDAVRALFDPAATEALRGLADWTRWSALLANTAIVAGVALLTAVVLGTSFGLLATRTDLPGRRLLTAAALLGACIPVYVSAIFFFSLVPLYALQNSAVAAGVLSGLVYTPLAILVLGAAFRAVDRELEDQALLDAGPWTVLRRVTIPQAGWGLIVLALLIVVLVATDMTISDLLVVRTFAEEVYSQYQLDNRRAGPLLTALPVLVVLALLLVTVQLRYRVVGEHWPWQSAAPPRVFALGRWRGALGVAGALVLAAGLGVPLVALLARARQARDPWAAVVGAQPELLTSLFLAATGATLVVLPAVGLAGSVVRGGRLRWITSAAIVVLLALPAPVVGISTMALLNRPGVLGWIRDNPLVVSVGYFVRFLPVGVLLLIPAVQRISTEIERAARVDGCDWPRLQWHIRWPMVARDAVLAWLVVVILCFAEVGATVLLHPPGWATAAVAAYLDLHKGVYGDLAVLALLSVAFILLPWGLLVWLLRRTWTTPRDA